MGRNAYLLLVAVLAAAVLAVGCGGDDNDSGGGGNAAETSTATTGDGGSSASDPDTAQTIVNCKQSVDAAQGLSGDVKKELRDVCEEAATGDEADARKASQRVCVRIIEETIPAGPARETGVQACKQSTQ